MKKAPTNKKTQSLKKGKGRTHGGGHDMTAMFKSNQRALRISSWLTGVYFFIELGLGIYSGSVAVISDAFHTFSAVGGVLLALIAGRIAARPADRYRTFGSIRAEIIGALFNGLFLFGMAVVVVYMGIMRLREPVAIDSGLMIIAAVGGLVTEIISLRLLFSGQKTNLNLKGAFWHIIQTFVGSLIIIVAATVIYFTDFVPIDPILGIAFGLVLFWASWGIIRETLRIIMETIPQGMNLDAVIASLKGIEGVQNIHHVHAWALTSGKNLFSAHIHISQQAKHEAVLKEASAVLKEKFGFYFATLQVEKECPGRWGAKDIDFEARENSPKI